MITLKHLGKYLKANRMLKWWIALFCASALGLCAIGIAQAVSGGGDDGVQVDAAGLDQQPESGMVDNQVNVSQLPDSSFIYDITIKELASADSYMDGQTVQVTGEVVGDRILSEPGSSDCWIMLQSDDAGDDSEVAVFMPVTASESIDTYGAYGKRGTTLQVRGTFNLACPEHQGASDLHSESVAVVSRGSVEKLDFNFMRLVPGLVLLLVGSVLLITFDIIRERQR